MKKYNLISIIFLLITNCYAHDARILFEPVRDSVIPVLDIKIEANEFLKNLHSVSVSDVNNDTLYLVNGSQFLYIDLLNNKISVNKSLTEFLKTQSKKGKAPTQLIIKQGRYYISFLDEIYCISPSGGIYFKYMQDREIYKFSVTEKDNILVSAVGKISLINKNGQLIGNELDATLTTPNYFKFAEGLGYYSPEEILLFTGSEAIKKQKQPNIVKNKIGENFYPCTFVNNNLIGFSYFKRSEIISISLNENEIKRTDLKIDFSPKQEEIESEEGSPNFMIIRSSDSEYVLSVYQKRLMLLKIVH